MCNFIHSEHTVPQKTQGIGYKLFTLDIKTNTLLSLITEKKYIHDCWEKEKGIIKWDMLLDMSSKKGEGFCFFYNLKEARKIYNISLKTFKRDPKKHIALVKIKYYRAFTRQIEKKFFNDHEIDIGLCKEFEILETLCYDPTIPYGFIYHFGSKKTKEINQ